jgi:hypothetical protein
MSAEQRELASCAEMKTSAASDSCLPSTLKIIFPIGVDVSTDSDSDTKSTPKSLNSSSARNKCDTERDEPIEPRHHHNVKLTRSSILHQLIERAGRLAIHEDVHGHKHVTLQLAWQEYKQDEPGGYQYSLFCELYRQWTGKLDLVLWQEHRAGEKLFVDYAGQTGPNHRSQNGIVTEALIFE